MMEVWVINTLTDPKEMEEFYVKQDGFVAKVVLDDNYDDRLFAFESFETAKKAVEAGRKNGRVASAFVIKSEMQAGSVKFTTQFEVV